MPHPIARRTLCKPMMRLAVLAATLAGAAGASLLDVGGPFGDVPPARRL